MKKVILILSVAVGLLFSCKCDKKCKKDTETKVETIVKQENKSELYGTYKGSLPCADCPSIETTVTLNDDKTFEITEVYAEKENGTFNYKGTFEVSEEGVLMLTSEKEKFLFAVESDKLILLDEAGNKNTSELAEKYELTKVSIELAGTYKGSLPCADCPSIEVTITLNNDNTYEMTQVYTESKKGVFNSKGKYSITEFEGEKFVSIVEGKIMNLYRIEKNNLFFGENELKKVK